MKREWIIEMLFHKNNMRKIKQALGKKCTYVAHERYKDNYSVVAKFGKEESIVAILNGSPEDIELEYYNQLKTDMQDEARKRGLL